MHFSTIISAGLFLPASLCSPLVIDTNSTPLATRDELPQQVMEDLRNGLLSSSTRRDLPIQVMNDLKAGFGGADVEKRGDVKIRHGLDWLPENVKRDFTALLNATEPEHYSDSGAIERRSDGSRYNCGNKPWVPVDNWKVGYELFCGGHVGDGNAIEIGYAENQASFIENGKGWRSMVFNTRLTEQDKTKYDKGLQGPEGHVYFFVHNSYKNPSGTITYDECCRYQQKQANTDSKCYRKDHKDTKGGAWNAPGWGLVGGLVYAGSAAD